MTQAEKLITEGKTVVLITLLNPFDRSCLHCKRNQFTYKLLTENKPKFQAILQNTIFMLVPSSEPRWRGLSYAVVQEDTRHPSLEGTSPPICIRSTLATTTIATGTCSRKSKRVWLFRSSTTYGIPKSSTMSINKAPMPQEYLYRLDGSDRSERRSDSSRSCATRSAQAWRRI